MALNSTKHHNPSLLESIGQKVQTAAQVAGTLKGIWDAGKAIYTIGRPALALAAGLL